MWLIAVHQHKKSGLVEGMPPFKERSALELELTPTHKKNCIRFRKAQQMSTETLFIQFILYIMKTVSDAVENEAL